MRKGSFRLRTVARELLELDECRLRIGSISSFSGSGELCLSVRTVLLLLVSFRDTSGRGRVGSDVRVFRYDSAVVGGESLSRDICERRAIFWILRDESSFGGSRWSLRDLAVDD